MRRIILLSTVLFATPFGIDCYAEDCVNSNCQTLGYTYPTNIGGCLQCPFGNYWFCPGNDDYCPNLGTLDSCPKGYKCEYEECSGKYYKVDGCQDSYVWDAEAKTCTCPNLGTLDSCPKGYKCVYEACSGKYYKVDGCQDSYVWDANAKTCTCPNKGNLSSCPTGYKCVYEACSGKYYKVDGCASGYDWNASSKTCTEHCYYSCSLASCPAHGNCSYENCTGKYCLYSCQTGYNLEGNSCVCPNKGTYSTCPTGYVCSYESCSNKYYKTGSCQSGYDKIGDECIKHVHKYMCQSPTLVTGNPGQYENIWGDQAEKYKEFCDCAEQGSKWCYRSPREYKHYGTIKRKETCDKCYYNSYAKLYYVTCKSNTECLASDGYKGVGFIIVGSSSIPGSNHTEKFNTSSECEAYYNAHHNKALPGGETCYISESCNPRCVP